MAGGCAPGKAFGAGSCLPVLPASGPCNFSPGESGGGGGSLRVRPGGTEGQPARGTGAGERREDEREPALLPRPAWGCRRHLPPPRSVPPSLLGPEEPPVPGQPLWGAAGSGSPVRVPGAEAAAPPRPLPRAGGAGPGGPRSSSAPGPAALPPGCEQSRGQVQVPVPARRAAPTAQPASSSGRETKTAREAGRVACKFSAFQS